AVMGARTPRLVPGALVPALEGRCAARRLDPCECRCHAQLGADPARRALASAEPHTRACAGLSRARARCDPRAARPRCGTDVLFPAALPVPRGHACRGVPDVAADAGLAGAD